MELTEYEMRSNFAKNLAYLRKAQKRPLSQRTLARVLKLSPYAINCYESCRAAPTAYAVYQVAAYFKVSMEKILTTTIV